MNKTMIYILFAKRTYSRRSLHAYIAKFFPVLMGKSVLTHGGAQTVSAIGDYHGMPLCTKCDYQGKARKQN